MNRQKGSILLIILLLLAGAWLVFVGYKYFQAINSVKQQNTAHLNPSPASGTPNYIQGELVVTFINGITYKETKDFFTTNGITNWTVDYWIATKFIPTDNTSLTTSDIFKIAVPNGKEDEFISKLSSSKIIRAVSKNFIIHTD